MEEKYEEAKKVIIEENKVSAPLLQRKLHIGYLEAARLVDELEKKGVVGKYNGVKLREILIK